MLRVIFFIALVLIFSRLSAQTLIRGTVKDVRGKAVAAASIGLKGSYDGATADSSGTWSFETFDTGDQVLVISAINFTTEERALKLNGTPIILDIVLKEDASLLDVVTITAGTFEASDTKRSTVLNSLDIVTTASANADVVSAIKTLPGAQQVGESEGLFVRGGTAEETKVFIDGTLVNNFFFSSVPDLAQRGRFSPFLFKGTVFSSGGYSALYGQALSSALILESIDLPDQSSASAGVSSVGLNGGFQQLAKNKQSSWGVNYSYTNLAAYFALVKQRPDNFHIPEFHNIDANFRVKTSATGMLKFYGYYNYNRLGVRQPDIDSLPFKNAFALTNRNLYLNLSWKESLGAYWKIQLGSSFSDNTDDIQNELVNQQNIKQDIDHDPFRSKSFSLIGKGKLTTFKTVLERKIYGMSAFRFGGEYQYFDDRNNFSGYIGDNLKSTAMDNLLAAFGEVDIYVTNKLAAKFGGRYEHSSLINKANIAPRLSMAYKTSKKGQISLAYGNFFQRPEKQFFLQGFNTGQLGYMKATHLIGNYQVVSHNYTFRGELFYKKYTSLIKTHPVLWNGADSISNAGYGDAAGLEIFWRDRKTFKNVDYWISYSYLDTKRDHLNFPTAIQPAFAAKHTANLVIKKFISPLKTQFNASYTYAAGRPYYDIRKDNQGKFRIFDQGKTIPYQSMSLSLNYLPTIGKENAKTFVVVVLSVNNVLGNNQVFGYNYSYRGERKNPILPAARRFFFIGCFLSFGVDRSDEIINSNL